MGNISLRLSRHEFACHCGCGFMAVDVELVDVLEDVADHFHLKTMADRCYIHINCGCRCVEHNEKVQKQVIKNYKPYSSKSKHVFGMAADFHLTLRFHNGIIEKVNPGEVNDYLEDKYPYKYGIGRYSTFTHIDVRPEKARW